jgi:antitoxin VapB
MALNLKNEEVERLAADVAAMTSESKTEAIRRALVERKARLSSARISRTRSERAASIVEAFRSSAPAEILGRRLSRAEEDAILGFGPGGV